MAHVIVLGKRRWLAGLAWSSYESVPSKAELFEDAARLQSSWVAVRYGEQAIQAGFCASTDGAQKPVKLRSLAAMLADTHEQPWRGVFQIEEGLWWYIAVRDDNAILPDGDVIGDADAIAAIQAKHASYTDWTSTIDGDMHTLADLIDDASEKPTPVRSLHGAPSWLPAAVLVTVVAAATVAGALWWHQHQLEAQHAQAAAMQAMRAQLANKAPAPVISPLLTTPEPSAWLAACDSVISPLPLSQNGWTPEGVSCDTDAVIVTWARMEGATVANKPDGVLSSDGEKVIQSIALRDLDRRGSNDAVPLPDAKLALLAWAQAAKFSVLISEVAPPPVLPGAENSKPAPPAPPQVNFKLALPISPFSLDLSTLPGVRLTRLLSSDSGWLAEGTLYGR